LGKIKILSEDLVNKISAGEVVERPASIVKELIENSLDAGSSRLVIEIEKGGRNLIRVSDDGSGILKDDLMLVCERHATSKVYELSDLENVMTLGFRGEALASISAVSYMKITSCPKEEMAGWCLEIAGGINKKLKTAGCPVGTTVEVMHIFFNTPVRKKFLKSIETEMMHITNITGIESIAHPEKGFKLLHNGRELINAAPAKEPAKELIERIRVIYGADLAVELLPITFEDGIIKVHGFIAKPSYNRADRRHQIFFINKRPIYSPALCHALSEAYKGTLPSNRYPAGIIFIEMDPTLVDVNVHPTKREVRFIEENRIHDSIVKCVGDALKKRESIGGLLRIKDYKIEPEEMEIKDKEDSDRSLRIKESIGRYLSSKDISQEKIGDLYRPLRSYALAKGEGKPIFLQAKDLYIITHDADGIVIIDQHAAHERVLFEEFMKKGEGGRVESQRLLFPITLEVSALAAAVLENALRIFHSIGFEIEPFGKNTFIVNAVPVLLERHDTKTLLLDTLDELAEDRRNLDSLKNKAEEAIILSACHSAVKASDRLNEEEISGLIEKLKATDSFSTCPHGRPAVFRLTWAELEKRFKRK